MKRADSPIPRSRSSVCKRSRRTWRASRRVERLVRRDTRECALLSAKLDEDTRTVTARWRMVGDFVWGARLDLEGTTVFSFREQERGGRIFSYDEVWHTPRSGIAAAVTPYRRPG